VLLAYAAVAQAAHDPIRIGLDADMSSGAAQSGEAIRRGALIAISEINASGGVLGRPLELIVKDHRGNPARGIDNILALAEVEELVAVLGGLHTPVALAELETIHQHKLIYLGPWAAGTPIVDNDYDPNFVFRVSVRDEHAASFLIGAAQSRGFKRPGLLLWRTAWGRSNEKAMKAAVRQIGLEPPVIQWFNSGEPVLTEQFQALAAGGADVILLVANPNDGLVAVRDLARMQPENRLPIISHWGITGGNFFNQAAENIAAIDLSFLQTFSFLTPPFPDRAKRVHDEYCKQFGPCEATAGLRSPAGIAHAYDLIHLLRLAIESSGSTDRSEVRNQLEQLPPHQGLMRNYQPAFTPQRHDALDARDFRLSRFDEVGAIVPMETR
jgi:branched-chain amino acid transport system substrate-binding protein